VPFSELHRQVAAVALRATARYGFVLGGGNALILHGLVERVTHDVDLVTDRQDGVRDAGGAVEEALRDAGFTVDRQDADNELADVFYDWEDLAMQEWVVTSPAGEQMILQIAAFDRNRSPVIMDVGPVMSLEDCLAHKVSAWASRSEERDAIDVAAALARYSVTELITLARQIDPGLEDSDFADAARRLDQTPDRLFTRYGLSRQDVARLRERLADWPRQASDVPAPPAQPAASSGPTCCKRQATF
jgi:predicted nucleotidyltransferase component of viral defense system